MCSLARRHFPETGPAPPVRLFPLLLLVILLLGGALSQLGSSADAAVVGVDDYLPSNAGWNGISALSSLNGDLGLRTTTDKTYRRLLDEGEALLVLLGPARSFSSRDLFRYVEDGGRVLLADDFGTGARLAEQFGPTFSGEPLLDNVSGFAGLGWAPVVRTFAAHPITLGIEVVIADHPTSLIGKRPTDVAFFSNQSYLDMDRDSRQSAQEPSSAYSFLRVDEVGQGRIAFVSDPSVFINAAVRFEGNARLYTNLLAWLVEGSGLEVVAFPLDLRTAIRGSALIPYQFEAVYLVLLLCTLAIVVVLRGQPMAARARAIFQTAPPSSALRQRLEGCLRAGEFGGPVQGLARRLKAQWARGVGVEPTADTEAIVAAHVRRFPRPETPGLRERLLTVGRALDKGAEGLAAPTAQFLVELSSWRSWILREIGLEGGPHERPRR